MDTPILDLSFLYEVSENDTNYILEVIGLYLESVPEKLIQLDYTVKETNDFDAIQKQAHFLKSSANIIKVRRMYEDLSRMEHLARQSTGKEEIMTLSANILANFRLALPLILTEEKKYKPGE